MALVGLLADLLVTQHVSFSHNDQIKDVEMGMACGAH